MTRRQHHARLRVHHATVATQWLRVSWRGCRACVALSTRMMVAMPCASSHRMQLGTSGRHTVACLRAPAGVCRWGRHAHTGSIHASRLMATCGAGSLSSRTVRAHSSIDCVCWRKATRASPHHIDAVVRMMCSAERRLLFIARVATLTRRKNCSTCLSQCGQLARRGSGTGAGARAASALFIVAVAVMATEGTETRQTVCLLDTVGTDVDTAGWAVFQYIPSTGRSVRVDKGNGTVQNPATGQHDVHVVCRVGSWNQCLRFAAATNGTRVVKVCAGPPGAWREECTGDMEAIAVPCAGGALYCLGGATGVVPSSGVDVFSWRVYDEVSGVFRRGTLFSSSGLSVIFDNYFGDLSPPPQVHSGGGFSRRAIELMLWGVGGVVFVFYAVKCTRAD